MNSLETQVEKAIALMNKGKGKTLVWAMLEAYDRKGDYIGYCASLIYYGTQIVRTQFPNYTCINDLSERASSNEIKQYIKALRSLAKMQAFL